MKILHLASFVGNIGDNASHIGLARILTQVLGDYQIEQLEIRRFYQSYRLADKARFDRSFIAMANQYDLLLIGGGGFLDYWVDPSQTGTTIDIAPALLAELTVPTLISSVGCAPHKAVPPGNIAKLRYFLDAILAQKNIRLAVRNDGSVTAISRDIGAHYLQHIAEILDHGFFYQSDTLPLLPVTNYVAINITQDQLGMLRANGQVIDTSIYYHEMARVIDFLCLQSNRKVVLVPHIPSDLVAINTLVSKLDDNLVRRYVSVAPLLQGDAGAKVNFSVYANSELVLASRLHANICSLAMSKPTIGLVALDRVAYVYQQLGLEQFCVDLSGSFAAELIAKIEQSHNFAHDRLQQELVHRRESTLTFYRQALSDLGVLA